MPKQEWTVRITVPQDGRDYNRCGLWLGELLRYAGLSRRLQENPEEVYELYCPKGTSDDKSWAKRNSERIRSFGIGAFAARKWQSGPL